MKALVPLAMLALAACTNPAKAPMTIQLMIPIALLLRVSSFASCWVVWRRGIGWTFDCH